MTHAPSSAFLRFPGSLAVKTVCAGETGGCTPHNRLPLVFGEPSLTWTSLPLDSGVVLNNRHKVIDLIAQGGFGEIYTVTDIRGRGRTTNILKVQRSSKIDQDVIYHREIQVLDSLSMNPNFPNLIDHFDIGRDCKCIVMTRCGDSLCRIVKRRECLKISDQNAIRIAYRLIDLLYELHDLGYYHRDLHWLNVTLDMNPLSELEVKLIDFGLCLAKGETPNVGLDSRWHHSLFVCCGYPYTAIDDYVPIVYLVTRCLKIEPFGIKTTLSMEAKKAQFHAKPSDLLPKGYSWLAKLYKTIENQRNKQVDIASMKRVLEEAIPEFDPASDIEYSHQKGQLILD